MSDEHDRTDHPLPGSVSDQNAEEAEPGHGGDTGGEHARRKGGGDAQSGGESGGASGGESGGEAGEGSQSTGHPDSAG